MPDEAPYRNFNFRVEIDGIANAGFAEVEIGDATIEVVEYREGSDRGSQVRKLPGRVRYGNVVLRRGVSQDLDLYRWFAAIRDGDLQRRNVAIVLQDASFADVRRWHVHDAWVTRYAGPTLEARGNDVVIEEVELACERIDVE